MHDDPAARLQLLGPDVLGDDELLSFLLTRGGPPGPEALRTARALLGEFGGLVGLSGRVEAELTRAPGVGPGRARRLVALCALARRLRQRPVLRGERCDEPRRVYEGLRSRIGEQTQEVAVVLVLDNGLRKLAEVEVARGSAGSVRICSAELFSAVLRERGRALVLAHNHPSGDPTPSAEDLELTRTLAELASRLSLRLVDHVIVCRDRFASLRELHPELFGGPRRVRAAERPTLSGPRPRTG